MKKIVKRREKNGQKYKSPEAARQGLRWLLDVIISVYMVLILVVMPFYNRDGFLYIGTNKSEFLRACSVNTARVLIPVLLLYLAAEVFLQIHRKQLKAAIRGIRLSVTDIFALVYGVSILLSHAFSAYQSSTLWGEEGWYMGAAVQLVMVATYFMVSRFWERKNWLIALVLPVSAVVFGLGLLNRFGIFPLDMKTKNVQFISTIGNINWYCGYMMSVFFAGFALLWQSGRMKLWKKALLALYVAIGFSSLVTQGSSSGVLTLAVVFLVTFCFSASDGKRMCLFWTELVIFSVVCLVICLVRQVGLGKITYIEISTEIFTNSVFPIIMTIMSVLVLTCVYRMENKGRYPRKTFQVLSRTLCTGLAVLAGIYAVLLTVNTMTGGAVSNVTNVSLDKMLTFSPTWGSNRGATWSAGVLCFLEQNFLHKLVGVGPDGMAAYLYTDGSSRVITLVTECFGKDRLTNAHNEWLTILVNMGIIGFAGYVGMMTTAICRFLGQRGKKLLPAACGFCLLAYTVNNMFSFQQAMNLSTIFIVLGVGENCLREKK